MGHKCDLIKCQISGFCGTCTSLFPVVRISTRPKESKKEEKIYLNLEFVRILRICAIKGHKCRKHWEMLFLFLFLFLLSLHFSVHKAKLPAFLTLIFVLFLYNKLTYAPQITNKANFDLHTNFVPLLHCVLTNHTIGIFVTISNVYLDNIIHNTQILFVCFVVVQSLSHISF